MSCISQEINRLQRDINETEYAIIRARKHGNIVKAEALTWKKGYMTEAMDELKEYMYQ